jgi:predicted RNA binding protein YcfA (HicA-like mRNA interferase family)
VSFAISLNRLRHPFFVQSSDIQYTSTLDLYATNTYNYHIGGSGLKRRDLIKLLEANGWYYKRDGGNHDIYTNGTDCEPISRQSEINEVLAKRIIKRRGLKQ